MKKSRILNATIAVVVFLLAYQLSDILRFTGLRNAFSPIGFSLFVNVFQILLCVAGIAFSYRVGFKKALAELGLHTPIRRAAVFSFLATLPMLLGFAFTSTLSPKLSLLNIVAFTIVSPFAEEVVFRGYIFRQLYRRIDIGFWSAALIPSLLFGLGHLYQSKGMWDFIGITAITGLGSIFFCWTFMRWQDNLWVPFGLHFLMNFWWMVFAVDETALGGWLANSVRLLAVIIAIVLTVNKDKLWKPLPIEEENILPLAEEEKSQEDIKDRTVLAQ